MPRPPTILFDISAHGLGHLAQSAPVIKAVAVLLPQANIIVRSGIPLQVLQARIGLPFQYRHASDDFGLLMTSSFAFDRAASAARYVNLHRSIAPTTQAIAASLRDDAVDLVVSNAGYLVLAASRSANIPSVVFSSINWHDIVEQLCGDWPGIGTVLTDMSEIYRTANLWLRLEPGTPMHRFSTVPVPELVVSNATRRTPELSWNLKAPNETLIVAFSFTQSESEPPPSIPATSNPPLICIGPQHWASKPPWVSFQDAGLPFLDLVGSADLIVAKSGYGIVSEAATANTPCIVVLRDEWPETASFRQWCAHYGRFEDFNLPLQHLTAEHLAAAHQRLSAKSSVNVPPTSGAARIASQIVATLNQPR